MRVQFVHVLKPEHVYSTPRICQLCPRPLLVVLGIKPQQINGAMQVPPMRNASRKLLAKADALGRYFEVAPQTRKWNFGQGILQYNWRLIWAFADFLVRRRRWESESLVRVGFFTGVHTSRSVTFEVRVLTTDLKSRSCRVGIEGEMPRSPFVDPIGRAKPCVSHGIRHPATYPASQAPVTFGKLSQVCKDDRDRGRRTYCANLCRTFGQLTIS
jgi:hypothetical protein